MITEEQKAELKVRLEKERDILQQELSSLGTQNPTNPKDWIIKKPTGDEFGADRNENADIIEGMQENNAALNELEGRLNNVMHALKKFDGETYGVCETEGEPIEFERLNANPAALTCMAHME